MIWGPFLDLPSSLMKNIASFISIRYLGPWNSFIQPISCTEILSQETSSSMIIMTWKFVILVYQGLQANNSKALHSLNMWRLAGIEHHKYFLVAITILPLLIFGVQAAFLHRFWQKNPSYRLIPQKLSYRSSWKPFRFNIRTKNLLMLRKRIVTSSISNCPTYQQMVWTYWKKCWNSTLKKESLQFKLFHTHISSIST